MLFGWHVDFAYRIAGIEVEDLIGPSAEFGP